MRSSVAEQSFMSAATTKAPAAARLRANSWPSPRAAPVMTTTLSRTANSVVLSAIASFPEVSLLRLSAPWLFLLFEPEFSASEP
jgi:hypothetical protein